MGGKSYLLLQFHPFGWLKANRKCVTLCHYYYNHKLMKKTFTIVMLALALTGARASVVINETNFPDENLRFVASQYDADEDGTLSDDELAEITEINAGFIMNLKGAEHFKNLDFLCLYYGSDENPSITSINLSLFPKLYRFSLQDCSGVTSLDFSKNPLLTEFEMLRCPNVSSLKLPASVEQVGLDGAKSLTALDVSQLPKLRQFFMINSGVTDLNFSANPVLSSIGITGVEDEKQVLNTVNLTNCDGLENIDIRYTTITTLTMKHLPIVRSLMMRYNDITSTTIEDCAEFNDITCNDNVLGTLCLKDNPLLGTINTEDNQLQVLIADNCPKLGRVQAFNNKLMWLDLKDAVKPENIEESCLKLDNQQPVVQAVKISPTEVGLRVHERLDVSRVKNLKAKGLTMEPKEIFVDNIRYFVIYNDGPSVASLVAASGSSYEYETKWPYPWVDGNSKDNNLPVTLNVASWTKHPSWIRIDGETTFTGEAGTTMPALTVLRSQDYNGKLTYRSSNEDVVKVDAETGAMTLVGEGTAVITVSGAETDYRLAPLSIAYTVNVTENTAVSETVNNQPVDRSYYDLQGRRTNSKKGVVIAGGQKMLKK